jgi:SNF2 family DNA or RNA helicase
MTKAVYELKCRHRLLLTGILPSFLRFHRLIPIVLLHSGTPVQNNLVEFWSILDWATAGTVLGTKKEFSYHFIEPILTGQDPKVCGMP